MAQPLYFRVADPLVRKGPGLESTSLLASSDRVQAFALQEGEKFERRAARMLDVAFPIADKLDAHVDVPRQNRLADALSRAQCLYIPAFHRLHFCHAESVHVAHGRLFERPDLMERGGRSAGGPAVEFRGDGPFDSHGSGFRVYFAARFTQPRPNLGW